MSREKTDLSQTFVAFHSLGQLKGCAALGGRPQPKTVTTQEIRVLETLAPQLFSDDFPATAGVFSDIASGS
jgi:hypothetical protein